MSVRPEIRRPVDLKALWRRGLPGVCVLGALILLTAGASALTHSASPKSTGSQEAPEERSPPSGQESPSAGRQWSQDSGSRKNPWRRQLDGPSSAQVGAALIGVLGLVIGAALIAKRYLQRARIVPRHRHLELEDALAIGPRRYVYLVRLKNRVLVLGAGGDRVSLLAEYDDADFDDPELAVAGDDPLRRGASSRSSSSSDPRTSHATRAYRSAQDDTPRAKVEAAARAGVERVPAPFRHLLEKALEKESEA